MKEERVAEVHRGLGYCQKPWGGALAQWIQGMKDWTSVDLSYARDVNSTMHIVRQVF
jgi:hypothetical protein